MAKPVWEQELDSLLSEDAAASTSSSQNGLSLPAEPQPVWQQELNQLQSQGQAAPGVFTSAIQATPEGRREMISADMGPGERIAVGAGRELQQLIDGARQLISQLNPYATEEEREALTQQIVQNSELWQQMRPEGFSTGLGEFAGAVAPGVLGAAAPARTFAQRVITGGAISGLEAGLQPAETPEEFWDQKLQQTLIGAGLGAGIQTGIEGLSWAGKKMASRFARPKEGAEEIANMAKEHEIRIGLADLSKSQIARLIDEGAKYAPASGTRQFKLKQLADGLNAAKRLTKSMMTIRDPDKTNEPLGKMIQNSLIAMKGVFDDASKTLYDDVYDVVEKAGRLDERIKPENVNTLLLALGEKPMPRMTLDTMRASDTLPGAPSLVRLQTMSREETEQHIKKATAKGAKASEIQNAMRLAARADIDNFLKDVGGDALVSRYAKAQQNYNDTLSRYKKKYESADIMEDMRTDNYDSIFNKYIRQGASTDTAKPQKLFDHLTEEGHEAVRYQILLEAMDKAVSEKGNFSPGRFTKAIDDQKGAVSVFFKDENKRLLNGMTKVFQHIDRAKSAEVDSVWTQISSNPAVWGPLFGGATMFSVIDPTTAVALGSGIGMGLMAKMMFTTEAGRDFLLNQAKHQPGSKKFSEALKRAMPSMIESFMANYAEDYANERQRQASREQMLSSPGGETRMQQLQQQVQQ